MQRHCRLNGRQPANGAVTARHDERTGDSLNGTGGSAPLVRGRQLTAVIADYDARIERELVPRRASPLWRLRRATAIETDLLRIQAEILRERRSAGRPARSPTSSAGLGSQAHPVLAATADAGGDAVPWTAGGSPCCDAPTWTSTPISPARQLTLSFQRLANLVSAIFERLGRYEAALARQGERGDVGRSRMPLIEVYGTVNSSQHASLTNLQISFFRSLGLHSLVSPATA
jgi:hypothetical protein